jgi:hypothetical protein
VYDSVYIARFSNADNRLEDRKLIRAWAWTTPDDKSLVTDSAFAFDIAAYMTDLKLRNQFPSDDLEKYTFTFTGSRLYLQSGTDTSLLVDSTLICRSQEWLLPSIYRTPLEHLTRHLEGMLSQARVVEYFQTGSFYYFLIRTGWGSGDTNFLQFIIPVPELTVRDGIRKLKGEK